MKASSGSGEWPTRTRPGMGSPLAKGWLLSQAGRRVQARRVLSSPGGPGRIPGMAHKSAPPSGPIKCFPNRHPDREYEIRIVAPEFTAVCPRTGQPDFATLTLTYVPGRWCLELKSFKLYLQGYR